MFDDIVEETEFSEVHRATVATDDRGETACERLHRRVANWNCRPDGVVAVRPSTESQLLDLAKTVPPPLQYRRP